MYSTTYYIDKTTNTFAENLAAFGLAFVLNSIADDRAKVRLEDRGYAFAVVCQPAIQAEWVDGRAFFSGAPFLVTTKDGKRLVKGTMLEAEEISNYGSDIAADYETEKRSRENFFTQLKALSKEERQALARGDLRGIQEPHPDWDIFRAINPASLQGYNAVLAEWWQGREAFPDLLRVILQMTCQTPNDVEGAQAAWKQVCKSRGWKSKEATAMQLFNPIQGKGSWSPKAVWSAPNNLKSFWLYEWLKIAGMYQGGITRLVAKSKDRKTYVLSPVRLDWEQHQQVMKKFRKAMATSETAIRMDILAALRYTQAFLEHFEGARAEDLGAELYDEPLADLVSGMQTAYYKDLGNAIAIMNVASINLPRWVAPSSPEDLSRLISTLNEHIQIVRNLDESHGDGYELLKDYRDFVSSSDLTPFFRFTTAYSGYVISQRERGKFAPLFTTSALEVLFMNSDPKYSEILQDKGFRNIAYAIRHSTVIPQGAKAAKKRPVVSIRYGLGQQLARKSAYPAEFLAELCDFLHLYNAENAQLRENNRDVRRKNITMDDIDRVTALVDKFGSRLVCSMLVAYGYAKTSKEGPEAPTEETGLAGDDLESPEVDDEEAELDDEVI